MRMTVLRKAVPQPPPQVCTLSWNTFQYIKYFSNQHSPIVTFSVKLLPASDEYKQSFINYGLNVSKAVTQGNPNDSLLDMSDILSTTELKSYRVIYSEY